MIFLIRMAVKNTFRKARRSLITAVTVLVGVTMIIVAWAFLDGLDNSVIRGQIRSDSGHFRIATKGYFAVEEIDELGPLLEDWTPLKEAMKAESEPKLLPRLSFTGELSDGRHGLTARGIGIEPDAYFKAFDLPFSSELKADALKDGVTPLWLGAGLAEPFGVKPGDTLTVLARTRYGNYTADEYTIAGIIQSQNAVIDSMTFFIPLRKAQELLDTGTAVTEVVGYLSRASLTEELPERMGAVLGTHNLEMQTWQQRAAPTLKLNAVRRKLLSVLGGVILLVAATGIANTMVMSCFERIREIGTMRALGFQIEHVVFLFLMEALVIGFLGATVGSIIGSTVIYNLRDGIDISSFTSGGNMAISMGSRLYFELKPARVATAFGIGLVVTMLAALYPSIKFSKLSALEAMKR